MKSNEVNAKHSWQPTLRSLADGERYFYDPYTFKKEKIVWEITERTLQGLPMTFSKCDMHDFGHSVSGTGEALFLKSAAIKAFAEAWERLWVMRIGSTDVLPEYKIKSSNGFAAARTLTEAKLKSRDELIERAALLKAWSTPTAWQQINPVGFIAKALVHCLNRTDWTTSFYEVRIANGGSLFCGLLRSTKFGAIFDCLYKSESTINIAAIFSKLTRSLARSINTQINRTVEDTWVLPTVGKPEDHGAFYTKVENLSAFDFLDKSPRRTSAPIALDDFNRIRSIKVIDTSGFPAVAFSHNDAWPPFQWGKQTITKENPWPHPLA
ncbi:MAG: hypothetical protein A2Z20_03110 [Bdellovibrionales bacterium RBG_16_40_8]|nr:MAG: hypothetical protein A2Z20_03110 [Bdellovibrionales bacterium RBG_16_40_8]